MIHQLALGACTVVGLAWFFISRPFKQSSKVKLLPLDRHLTVREPDELSILCYNVLADNLVSSQPAFNYVNELYRSWEYRIDKLRDQITVMGADIVCLQEVEIGRWQKWRRFMDDLGYGGVMLKRQKKKNGKHQSITIATFFRLRRFEVCWEQHCSRALGVGLKWIRASGEERRLFVVNVHLEGHPYKPAERAHQVNAILKEMENKVAESGGENYDVVFCGDFNSARCNAPWQYLYGGRLEAGYTEPYYPDIEIVKETTAHPFALVDVYKTANAIPDFTARSPRRRSEVDFIFASRHLKVAAVLRAMDPRVIPYVDRTLLPNKLYPSDHLPLGVVLAQPKKSEMRLDIQHSMRPRYSEDADSLCYEVASGSVCSDSANNVDFRPTVECVDGDGGVKIRSAVRQTHRFLDDTALM